MGRGRRNRRILTSNRRAKFAPNGGPSDRARGLFAIAPEVTSQGDQPEGGGLAPTPRREAFLGYSLPDRAVAEERQR